MMEVTIKKTTGTAQTRSHAWVEVTVSQGDRKINNDADGGQKKKRDAAKEQYKGQNETPTFLPTRREVVAGKGFVWAHRMGQKLQVSG